MPKLTQQQVQFIYNYLENSGIQYLDARVEMTDHVASGLEAMEGDFYENFKTYMLEHKESLLAQYGRFKKIALNKGLTVLKNNVFSLWFVAAVAVLVLLGDPAANFYSEEIIVDGYSILALVPGGILALYLTYTKVFCKWSFSIMDQLFAVFLWAGFIIDPIHFLETPVSRAIYYSTGIVFNTATVISYYKIHTRYNRLYVQNLKLS